MRQLFLTSTKKQTTVSLVPKTAPIKEEPLPDYALLLRKYNEEQREIAIRELQKVVGTRALAIGAAKEAIKHATEVRELEQEVRNLRWRINRMESER